MLQVSRKAVTSAGTALECKFTLSDTLRLCSECEIPFTLHIILDSLNGVLAGINRRLRRGTPLCIDWCTPPHLFFLLPAQVRIEGILIARCSGRYK